MLSNFEKWRLYTEGLPSPENYIDWSWYYIVAAALQRRVWLGPENQQCFPNMYVILVGPPGTGKGLVLREVTNLLRHWTLDMGAGTDNVAKTDSEKAQVAALQEVNVANATKAEFQGQGKGPNKDAIKPLLIPVCADAITYEALVLAVGKSYSYIQYRDTSKEPHRILPYGHSSQCFILQELSSLMRKRTNDTINFILGLYDCPKDYEYTTITRQTDRIRRGCLNIIAGTTPSFMQSTFDEGLIGEGFTSRTFYIYAPKNRYNRVFLDALTKEQEEARDHLLEHIKKLSSLYGPAKVSKETAAWFQDWWDNFCKTGDYANKSPEMIPYYARLNIHVMKLAMCLLFGEDASVDEHGKPAGEITVEILKRAIAILRKEEVNMHHALILEGNNPVAKAAQKMLEILRSKNAGWIDLYISCSKIAKKVEIEEALEMLQVTNQIVGTDEIDKLTKDTVKIYHIK